MAKIYVHPVLQHAAAEPEGVQLPYRFSSNFETWQVIKNAVWFDTELLSLYHHLYSKS